MIDAALRWHARAIWRRRRNNLGPDAPTALLVGFAPWKTFILDYLSEYNVVVLSHSGRVSAGKLGSVTAYKQPHVFAWSYRAQDAVLQFCEKHGVPLTYVEDGFIRSVGLGADRTNPVSLVFDDQAMHFDRLKSSSLEQMLATYDFDADPVLMNAARELRWLMLNQGLSKYMLPPTSRVADVAKSDRPRILVLGQVEDDLSIRFGAETLITGNQLVLQAAKENPTAHILYRPHPEALAYAKPHYSDPADVVHLCTILGSEFEIGNCIDNADVVYTVTSLAGFEAALRGKKVVTMGAPFYSGWGFTEDRLPLARRTRRLTPEAVLAGAYLLYPRYVGVDPHDGAKPEAVLSSITRLIASASNPADGER